MECSAFFTEIPNRKGVTIEKGKMSNPIHVTDDRFEETVLRSAVPVLVDFWAPWCGPCRMISPLLDKVAEENAGKLLVAKVNTDEQNQWAIKYGVQGIPTMLFIDKGKVVKKQVGALPEASLKKVVKEFLAQTI